MLTRLEIDNFRCFEGFVWEPARKQLILGANGCGKSSMMDALSNLRKFVAGNAMVEELFPLGERTNWLNQPDQRFSLSAEINGVSYCYSLVVGASGRPAKPVVQSEKLDCNNGALVVIFEQGHVTLDLQGGANVVWPYELKANRSVISSLNEAEHTVLAIRFADWMETVRVFQLNPFNMVSRSEKKDWDPNVDLSNFASWYRYAIHLHPERIHGFFEGLRESMDGFKSLHLDNAGEDVKVLMAEFNGDAGAKRFRFDKLSEGQRCLICLYAILHFIVGEGGTVVIDEPENFISLREIQPWWISAENAVEDARGQLILASHHPEFIDQWAPPYGVKFARDGAGPVRIKPWTGDPGSMLSAAELVARGWDDD